jgi:ABC-2 type transport system ATP-binding protein
VLSEVERVCDRFALLRKGELVLLSAVEASRKLAARRVRVFFNADVGPPKGLPAGIEIIELDSRVWNLKVEGVLKPLLDFVVGLPVEDIQTDQARLEDVVMKYYREGVA